MAKENFFGQMGINMTGNGKMKNDMGKDLLTGPMGVCMLEIGKMELLKAKGK